MTKNFLWVIIFFLVFGFNLDTYKEIMSNKKDNLPLKIAYFSCPTSFHPRFVSDIGTHTICKALFEGLTRIAPNGKAELAIAERVQVSTCKTKYIFTLRSSRWSNGEELTSYHFADNWKRSLINNQKCIHVKRFFLIKNAKLIYNKKLPLEKIGIYTPSKKELIIELEHPAPYFLQLLADPIYSPVYDSKESPTVFNGPFITENYSFNKQLNLIANPFYWDNGKVPLSKIQILFVKDIKTSLSMYEKNEIDWLGSPFTSLPDESTELLKTQSQNASAPFWIFCNSDQSKLQSAKIRKALAYALNREEITKYVLPKQTALYTVLPQPLSSLDSKSFLKHNKETAQELFEQGLKELNLHKDQFQLTLSHSNIAEQEKLAVYLKYQWEKTFGIKVFLKKEDWNTFYSNIKSGDYEIGGFYLFNLYDDPSYFMELFEFSYSNFAKWENQTYQKYISLARKCDPEQRKGYLQQAEMILMEEMPVIPVYNHRHLYLCNDRLKGFSAPIFNYADFKWAYFDD